VSRANRTALIATGLGSLDVMITNRITADPAIMAIGTGGHFCGQ